MWRLGLLWGCVGTSAFADPLALDGAANVGVTGVHCTREVTEAAFGCTAGDFDVAPSFGVDAGIGFEQKRGLHLMLRTHASSRFSLEGHYLLQGSVDVGVRMQLGACSALHVGLGPQAQLYGAHDSQEGGVGLGLFVRWESIRSAHTALGVETIPNLWQRDSDIRVFDLRGVLAVRR